MHGPKRASRSRLRMAGWRVRSRCRRRAGAGAEPGRAGGQRAPHLRLRAWRWSPRSCATRSCALAMDLIWGYTGILSLGHGAVLRARRLRDGHVPDAPDRPRRQLPRATCPTSWCSSTGRSCPGTGRSPTRFLCAVCPRGAGAGPARVRVRLLRLPLAHQGRVLLDHHAGADLRRDAAVLPQRDRLRRQQRLHRLQAHPRHPDRHAADAHGAVRASPAPR